MQRLDTVFQRELKRLVDDRILNLKDNLAVNCYEDVASFKYLMGKIAALNELDEIMDQAREAAEQRNR